MMKGKLCWLAQSSMNEGFMTGQSFEKSDVNVFQHHRDDFEIVEEPDTAEISAENFILEPPFVNPGFFRTQQEEPSHKYYSPKDVMTGENIPAGTVSGEAYLSYIQNEGEPSKAPTYSYGGGDLMLGIMILSFLLLAIVKFFYSNYLNPVLASFYSFKSSRELFRNKNSNIQNTLILLNFLFPINGGIFLVLVFDYFGIEVLPAEFSFLSRFLIKSFSLYLLYSFIVLFLRVLGYVFDKKGLFYEYVHNISLFAKIYGVLLFPLIAGIIYASPVIIPVLIYTALFFAGLLYAAKLVRGFKLLQNNEFSVFYVILYLCMVEIIPVIVMFRLFQTYILM